MKKLFFTLLFALPFGLTAQVELVQPRFTFDTDLKYNADIPSPEQFLEYQLGEEITLYQDVESYVKALAASDGGARMRFTNYGETYEGRKLYHALITSPKNMQRLDELITRHKDMMEGRSANPSDVTNNDPVFVSLSYNIHGNETSCTEAAMQVAYRLAAAQDEQTMNWLDNTVVSIFFCLNPDGRDRYVYWYKGMKRGVVGKEPRDLEHYEPWPNGRTNHYWFDLNRDWVWCVHPESKGHIGVYQEILPNVHVDYHEMGYNNNYFTAPGTTPRNLLLPDKYESWSDTFGRANIAFFDDNQLNYFTREAFDFFYPGYGSSYPSVMGAIGMLTEQGGIGGGRAVTTDDGYILTLRQRVYDHYNTSLATIDRSAANRVALQEYSRDAMDPASSKSDVKGYYIPVKNNEPYLADLVEVLQRQGVELSTLESSIQKSVIDFWDGKTKRKRFDKGTMFISTNQSRHLFINTIMNRQMMIEDSVMYDMSTWAAPFAYNLEAYYTTSSDLPPVSKVADGTEVIKKVSNVVNPNAKYAYVIDWSQRNAPKALSMLWEKGYRVRAALEAFSDGTQSFVQGTLIVLKGRNRERASTIVADMNSIAAAAEVKIVGLNTGRMEQGNDLASRKSTPLKQPKVALMVEPPFSTYTTGQIYYLFDKESALPIERVRTSILKQTAIPKFGQRYGLADLNDYDVLILTGGGQHLGKLFDKKYSKELETWIRNGGTLVTTESAATFFTAKRSPLTKVELHALAPDTTEEARYLHFEDREDFYGKKRIPGSALKAKIDNSNPLAFGMEDQLYSIKFGANALVPSRQLQTVGHYLEDPAELLASGYASEQNLKHLAGHTFAGVLPMGQGKIVYLLDNTQYRMFWRGPSRMMQNAVMLLPSF
ncbi:MAG: M14 family zinc carboxypeptidase [Bacteroidota bacterium]